MLMKLSNKKINVIKSNLLKGKDQIYTIGFEINPNKSGIMAIVPETMNEDVYHYVRPNLGTASHKGKVQVGLTPKNGFFIKMAFNSVSLLSHGIDEITGIADGIVHDGIKGAKYIDENPRKDLQVSLNSVTLYCVDGVNVNYPIKSTGITKINKVITDVSNKPLYDFINKTRLIPDGYDAQIKKEINKK